jgi:hypothetical protein
VATVLLDLFIPTLVIIGLMVISLLIRREHLAVMGFKRPQSWLGMADFTLIITFLLQLFDVGVVVSSIDALVFSWLKRRFDNNLWAAILARGFYNSIGVIVFYFTGPIYSLW